MSESLVEVVAMLARVEQERVREMAGIRAELARLKGPGDALTISEFARRAKCSPNTVRRAIDEGRLRTVDLGDRTTRVPSSELEGSFIAERRRRQLRTIDGGKPPTRPGAGRKSSRKAG